jgi:hypothetical protein
VTDVGCRLVVKTRRLAIRPTADRPDRAASTRMNGKASNSSVAARSMARFMKSKAFRRFHKYSADEPVYFSLPASIPRRTRCRTPDRSWV